MSEVEMRMLRNEKLRGIVGLAPIEDKVIKNRIRWFGHVYRRTVDAVVRRSDMALADDCLKGSGRLKLTLEAVVRKDLGLLAIFRTRFP